MGFAKPIEQIFIKLSRYIYVSKRYYTKENGYEKEDDGTALVGGYGTFCGNPYRLRTESL